MAEADKLATGERILVQPTDALLVIDVQLTFMPGGGLPVPGGEQVMPVIRLFRATFSFVRSPRGVRIVYPLKLPLQGRGRKKSAFGSHVGIDPSQFNKVQKTHQRCHCEAESEAISRCVKVEIASSHGSSQ